MAGVVSGGGLCRGTDGLPTGAKTRSPVFWFRSAEEGNPAWRDGTSAPCSVACARAEELPTGTALGSAEAVRTTPTEAWGEATETAVTWPPEAAKPPDTPRCAMTIDGIASPSTAANPISNRGFIILSAAPCSYDATNHTPVAGTLTPSAVCGFVFFSGPAGHLCPRSGVYAFSR